MRKMIFFMLTMPCYLMFNGNEDTMWINLLAMCYTLGLWWFTAKTGAGRRFFRKVYRSR